MISRTKEEIKQLTKDDLIAAYEEARDHVAYVWGGCRDESGDAAWYNKVWPYRHEMEERGIWDEYIDNLEKNKQK